VHRVRRFSLRSLGVVLTLCLAIMCTSAAAPTSAHAGNTVDWCEDTLESSYAVQRAQSGLDQFIAWGSGIVNAGKCQIGALFTVGHDALFGAAELLWEGIYGAGCGIKNLATWNGTSCDTSVAESGDKARNMLNDWADCIGTFDVFSPGGSLGALVAWDSMDEQVLEYEVRQANDRMTATVESVAIAGGVESVEAFVRSPGGQEALAGNPAVRKALGKAIPGVNAALVVKAIASECFNDTIEQLTAIQQLDEDLGVGCQFPGGRSRAGVTTEECSDSRLERRYLTDANIANCLAGRSITVGRTVTTPPSLRGSRTTSDEIVYDGADGVDVCSKVILPEARDRGLIDADDLAVVNTLAPAAPPAAKELVPSAVPGGSTTGDCGIILRSLADGGGGSYSDRQRATCTGTLDEECQLYRSRIAIGRPSRFTNRADARAMEELCM
jgi:hypothetical protein